MSELDPYFRPRSEPFEVVLVKNGVNPLHAEPTDFKRVPVNAADPTSALASEVVQKAATEGGYTVFQAAKAMVMTDYEHQARIREDRKNGIGMFDRTKI
jgi:hypothetical protein